MTHVIAENFWVFVAVYLVVNIMLYLSYRDTLKGSGEYFVRKPVKYTKVGTVIIRVILAPAIVIWYTVYFITTFIKNLLIERGEK